LFVYNSNSKDKTKKRKLQQDFLFFVFWNYKQRRHFTAIPDDKDKNTTKIVTLQIFEVKNEVKSPPLYNFHYD